MLVFSVSKKVFLLMRVRVRSSVSGVECHLRKGSSENIDRGGKRVLARLCSRCVVTDEKHLKVLVTAVVGSGVSINRSLIGATAFYGEFSDGLPALVNGLHLSS